MNVSSRIFAVLTLILLIETGFIGYIAYHLNLTLQTYAEDIVSKIDDLETEISKISEVLNKSLTRSKYNYFLIDNRDFLFDFGSSDAWLKEMWNKNEYTKVEISNGILHLECNNTGEWGNAGVYEGKHIDLYDYTRKMLAVTSGLKQVYVDYVEYYMDISIKPGENYLEVGFRINEIKFTNYSVSHPNQYARANLGITLMIAYNDSDIYGENEKIYFDIFFTGYCVNQTNIWNVPKNFSYCQYHEHVHTGYCIEEVKPEEFGTWKTIEIDLGYYLNSLTNLIRERDIYKFKVIGFIVFTESSGCYVDADYDYIRTTYQPTTN